MRKTERLSRASRQAATRRRLVAAGRRRFLAEGFHGAALENIALDCGVTKGAVYANFAHKGALFLAVLDANVEGRTAAFDAIVIDAGGIDDLARKLAEVMIREGKLEGRWVAVLAEAWALASSDTALRAALQQRHERILAAVADLLHRHLPPGLEFTLPLREVARAGGALMRGLLLERLLDPGSVSDAAFVASFAALVRGLVKAAPAARRAVRAS